ncbi:MAG: cyclic nucleotide-binding domain-containing protein [Caldilineaceae bacterium]
MLSLLLLAGMALMLGRMIPVASAAGYRLKCGEARLVGKIQENALAHALIRAFGFEAQMLASFEEQIADLTERGATATYQRASVSLVAKVWMMVARLVIIGVGALLVTYGLMTIGSLIAFLNLVELINASASDLVRSDLPDFIGTTSGIQRVEELLQERPDIVDSADAVAIPPLQRAIAMNNVSFSYTGEESNLQAINMTIPAGASVAFVGASGSGKSTLLSLLIAVMKPPPGRSALTALTCARCAAAPSSSKWVWSSRRVISLTPPSAKTFAWPNRTPAMPKSSRPPNSPKSMNTCCACRTGMIPVGEAGNFLSGGQRQRIAIARAIIRNPAILILDEATSARDPGTESAVSATLLRRLTKDRTVISVTHRLSSVVDFDHIYVLQDGRLVESGSHAALQQQGGVYAQLWHKQSGFAVSADGRSRVVHAAYLRHIDLFRTLSFETLTTLAGCFTPIYIGAEQTIIQEGEMGDKLYLIARGQVEVLVRTAQGDTVRLDTMHDGDHFGEMALISDAPRNATIRTLTDSLLLTLPKAEFLALLQSLPSVRTAVDTQIEHTLAHRDRLHEICT